MQLYKISDGGPHVCWFCKEPTADMRVVIPNAIGSVTVPICNCCSQVPEIILSERLESPFGRCICAGCKVEVQATKMFFEK